MKNLVTYIFKNIGIIGFVFLSTVSAYCQLQSPVNEFAWPGASAPERQRKALEKAAKYYLEVFYGNNGRVTIAFVQLPDTNTFLVASSSPTINPTGGRSQFNVIKSLEEGGFSNIWNGEAMKINFVTGSSGVYYSTEEELPDVDGFLSTYYHLPTRNGTAADGTSEVLHVHAEMALVATLAQFWSEWPSQGLNNVDRLVIQSSRDFCPRCYNWLDYSNLFYVPSNNVENVQNSDFISTQNWSPPNFNNRSMPVNQMQANWDSNLREATRNYLTLAGNFGIIASDGKNILAAPLNLSACPENVAGQPNY